MSSAGKVAYIGGSTRPQASGHRFGPELDCIECGTTWGNHQLAPAVCTPVPKITDDLLVGSDQDL